MDDDEALCSTCADQERHRIPIAVQPSAPVEAPRGSATAVLERPSVVPLSESATFRQPKGAGVSMVSVVVLVLLAALLSAAVVLGFRHQGPLAGPLQTVGLIDPPSVVVPEQWSVQRSPAAGFAVSMPVGAEETATRDELAGVGLTGWVVDLGSGATMLAASTDFGLGAAGLAPYDSETGLSSLADLYISSMGLGEETVRREVQVEHGRAYDSVIVANDDTTTRARFMLVGDRFVVLQTSGPDTGADALDEAHPLLVDGFDPDH